MDLSPKERLVEIPSLRTRLRQLHWYTQAFRSNADLIGSHLGITFQISPRLLNKTFFDWVAAIAPVEQAKGGDRADRILFVGGLALRELLRTRPASVSGDASPTPAGGDTNMEIARFWPEGFLYTNFCVCSIAAVHQQEFGQPLRLQKAASDLRTWWSYRENASEDPALGIAFLDKFFGVEPNWQFPTDPHGRMAVQKTFVDHREPKLVEAGSSGEGLRT